MNRKLLLFVAITVFAASSAFADKHTYSHGSYNEKMVRGNDSIVTRTVTVESFDRITSDLGINFHITVGQPLSVKISFDENLVDFIETEVHNGELEITTDKSFTTYNECFAEITIPSLKELHIEGASEIEIIGLKENEFILDIDGSAKFRASGTVDTLYIDLDGSANIDAREIKAHSVRVDIDGTGNVKVFADEEFDGSIDGVGNIVYYGDPKQTYKNVAGMGKIRAK